MELAGRFHPRVRLVCWENTHNFSGGRVVPVDVMQLGFAAADVHGLAKHVDGARLFNAAVALGVEAASIVEGADTVSFCFSKGLGAPVGSAVVGSGDMIEELRYLRARLGGGMRQVGVLAAAASIALRDRDRLAEDHELARYLATQLTKRQSDLVDLSSVETNIVNIRAEAITRPWPDLAGDFEAAGIAVYPPFDERFRVVTHRDVDRADVDRLVDIVTRAQG
jgi:threonine aldolase